MPNLKSLKFFPPSQELFTGLLPECTALKVELLQARQICCLPAYMCAFFSPENLRAGAVKGLIVSEEALAGTRILEVFLLLVFVLFCVFVCLFVFGGEREKGSTIPDAALPPPK